MAGFRPENRVIGLRRFTAACNRILRPRRKIHKNPRHVRGFLYKTEQKFRPSGGTFVPPGFVRAAGSAHPLRSKAWFRSRFVQRPTRPHTGNSNTHTHPAAFPHFGLRIGRSAAHDGFCLMLLGSPPDMVHSPPLRSTGSSSPCEWLPRRMCAPCYPHSPR